MKRLVFLSLFFWGVHATPAFSYQILPVKIEGKVIQINQKLKFVKIATKTGKLNVPMEAFLNVKIFEIGDKLIGETSLESLLALNEQK